MAFWVLLALLLASLAALGYIAFTYWQGQQDYEQVAEVAKVEVEGDDLAAFQVDWEALRAINPDVVGWIYVPGTNINYPVVWREGNDAYYLWHNFNGAASPQFGAEYGCPVLSGSNDPAFTDDVNIVSAHNLFNGEMFTAFSTFGDPAVFNAHRIIFLLTPEGNYRLRTFAVDYVSGSSRVPVTFASAQEKHEYYQQCMDDSLVQPDPPPPAANSIQRAFAFYTCDNNNSAWRFFIFGYPEEYVPLGVAGMEKDIVGDEDANAVNAASGERAQ